MPPAGFMSSFWLSGLDMPSASFAFCVRPDITLSACCSLAASRLRDNTFATLRLTKT